MSLLAANSSAAALTLVFANFIISFSWSSRISPIFLLASILSAKVLVSSSLICLCVSASKSFFSINPCICASASFEEFAAAVVAFACSRFAFILIWDIWSITISPIDPISVIASPTFSTTSFPAFSAANPTSLISLAVPSTSALSSAIFPSSPPPKKLSSQANIRPCTAPFIVKKANFKGVKPIVIKFFTTLVNPSNLSCEAVTQDTTFIRTSTTWLNVVDMVVTTVLTVFITDWFLSSDSLSEANNPIISPIPIAFNATPKP